MNDLRDVTEALMRDESRIREASGRETNGGAAKQRHSDRLSARQRIGALVDPGSTFFELGIWAAWRMYDQWGEVPAAGVIVGIGRVCGRPVMVVANDSSVKAGAFFPQSVKKVLRAQKIAMRFRLPLLYLVDSAGVFLPLQDEIFPDEDDFGRIFRNNAVLSAMGVPQYAAVMGNCIAGGAYLPVLCDKLLMTDGSQMCLAGRSLVKAAIGQDADPESLGGAKMHSQISGTVDFREPDDEACIARLRSLVGLLPDLRSRDRANSDVIDRFQTERPAEDLYDLVSADGRREFDTRDVIRAIVDADSIQEYKSEYGPTLITTFAKLCGRAVGIVANQRKRSMTAEHQLQIGGVLYGDSVEKAARFVNDCNQVGLPLIFLQDVQGFMVGVAAEQSGIIRSGAELVHAVSTATVPKLTVIIGGSFGAGNYALCGKAYDPWLIVAWPNARYAVMGAASAAGTLTDLRIRDAHRQGHEYSTQERDQLYQETFDRYQAQTDIRYGAARGWVDAIIAPDHTRRWLHTALEILPDRSKCNDLSADVNLV
ncbi:acyl-CoA carboxylase subunit beta [Stieleria maiorica]|nr:carboxyl transferase domain-containing protein [Stieleria maiorica]